MKPVGPSRSRRRKSSDEDGLANATKSSSGSGWRPVIKILDLGLARLDNPASAADMITTLTKEQTVLGTPDYIAPEQARNPHTADIRADLYSLGCTFYYLLTGEVPFPGDTAMEKLIKHSLEVANPLERLRPDVPPRVAAVVRKLMAKRPEDRFQTPAELAAELGALMQYSAAQCRSATAASNAKQCRQHCRRAGESCPG